MNSEAMQMPKKGETSPNRLDVWGDSMMGKLPAVSRKRGKRTASKKRRVLFRKRDQSE
jgi:hypothetical protein